MAGPVGLGQVDAAEPHGLPRPPDHRARAGRRAGRGLAGRRRALRPARAHASASSSRPSTSSPCSPRWRTSSSRCSSRRPGGRAAGASARAAGPGRGRPGGVRAPSARRALGRAAAAGGGGARSRHRPRDRARRRAHREPRLRHRRRHHLPDARDQPPRRHDLHLLHPRREGDGATRTAWSTSPTAASTAPCLDLHSRCEADAPPTSSGSWRSVVPFNRLLGHPRRVRGRGPVRAPPPRARRAGRRSAPPRASTAG